MSNKPDNADAEASAGTKPIESERSSSTEAFEQMTKAVGRSDTEFYLCILALCLFSFAYVQQVMHLQRLALVDAWQAGDWLIDYSGGFVRRGLFGEIASMMTRTGAGLVEFVYLTKAIVYISTAVLFVVLALKQRLGVVELMLVLSPWAFMFNLNFPNASGRKEILLIGAFMFYAVGWAFTGGRRGSLFVRWDFWFLILALPILTLIHEGLFFFFPFFALIPFVVGRLRSRTDYMAILIPYTIALLVFLTVYNFRGTSVQVDAICDDLVRQGLEQAICNGGVGSLAGYAFTVTDRYFKIFGIAAILTAGGIACYAASALSPPALKRFGLAAVGALLLTAPLYVVAADWGRWIHISAMLLVVSLLTTKEIRVIPLKLSTPIVIFFLLITPWIYLFGWRLPHFLGEDGVQIMYTNDFVTWIGSLLAPIERVPSP